MFVPKYKYIILNYIKKTNQNSSIILIFFFHIINLELNFLVPNVQHR